MAKRQKKDWVSGADVVGEPRFLKRAFVAVFVGLLLIAAVFLIWKPKPLIIDKVVPSGAVVFVRMDHAQERLKQLRASGFWQGFSKINVPKILEHAKLDPNDVSSYNAWRDRAVGVIDHPLFNRMFGQEVAFAVYPSPLAVNPADWTSYLSGTLLATRIDRKTQIAESLAVVWSQGSGQWSLEQKHYKNNLITAVHFNDSQLTVYYTRLGDLLIFSLNENLVASSIDTTRHKSLSLSEDEDFAAVAKTFYNAPDGVVYLRMSALARLLSGPLQQLVAASTAASKPKETADDADNRPSLSQRGQQALQGLQSVKSVGASLAVGRPLKTKIDAILNPEQPEAKGPRCSPTENPTISFIPKQAAAYQWDNCTDMAEAYRWLEDSFKQANTDNPSEGPFAQLEKTWGFTIANDILPVLGRQTGWFVQSIDVKGLFPVPRTVFFMKVNDEQKADAILKGIATTPVTVVQEELYVGIPIRFVSIPLFAAFKPSYTFIDGFVLIASSDTLIKASIDAHKTATAGLREDNGYKELSARMPPTLNAMLYLDVAKTARQSRALVDWTSQWFTLKITQTRSEIDNARRKLENLAKAAATKSAELKTAEDRLAGLRKEEKDLKKAYDASALGAEAGNTLAQAGPVTPLPRPSPDDVRLKTDQVAAVELEVAGLRREVEDLQSQVPDLEDDIDDMTQQSRETQNLQYLIDEVIVPFLQGLESLDRAIVHTTTSDHTVESELLLKVD